MQTPALRDDRDGGQHHQQPPQERHAPARPVDEEGHRLGQHEEKIDHDERVVEPRAAEPATLEEAEDVRQEERDSQYR